MLYLNRLSDLLFILARVANPAGDVLWKPGGGTTLSTPRATSPGHRYASGHAQSERAATTAARELLSSHDTKPV